MDTGFQKTHPVSLHLLSGSTAPHHPRPAWPRGRCATSHIPAQKNQMAMWNTGPFRRGNTGAARSHQVAAVFSAPRIQAEGNKEESEVGGRGPNPKADSLVCPCLSTLPEDKRSDLTLGSLSSVPLTGPTQRWAVRETEGKATAPLDWPPEPLGYSKELVRRSQLSPPRLSLKREVNWATRAQRA